MVILKECLHSLVKDLDDACEQKDCARICEESRELLCATITSLEINQVLGAAISSEHFNETEWFRTYERDIDCAFRKAVATCSGRFSDNVLDRYIDFLVIKRLLRLNIPKEGTVRKQLLWLHVAVRNLWREFVRESLDDPDLGRRELAQITVWTAELFVQFAKFFADGLPPLLQNLCGRIADDLLALSGFVNLSNKTKLDLRLEGCRQCSFIVQRLAAHADSRTFKSYMYGDLWPRAIWEAAEDIGVYPLPLLQTHTEVHELVRQMLASGADFDDDAAIHNLISCVSGTLLDDMGTEDPNTGSGSHVQSDIEQLLSTIQVPSIIEREQLRAQLFLQLKYPGEHVAFRDVWSVDENSETHLHRQIIAHSSRFRGMYSRVEEWRQQNPQLKDERIDIEFVEPFLEVPTPDIIGSDG